jgi:hypothetical protein
MVFFKWTATRGFSAHQSSHLIKVCYVDFAGKHIIRNIANEFLGSPHGSPEQLVVANDRDPLSGTVP